MSPSRTLPRSSRARPAAGPVVVICDRCGYLGQYLSQGLADHHHPRHSCARQQQQTIDAARRAASQLSRAAGRRDCTHPRARQHGTRTAYVADRCRCTPCTDANTTAAHEARAAGDIATYVPADASRAHLRRLLTAGIAQPHRRAVRCRQQHPLRAAHRPLRRPRPPDQGPHVDRAPATRDPPCHRTARTPHPRRRHRHPPPPASPRGPRLVSTAPADRLDRRPDRIDALLTAGTVVVATARTVHALYDDLWDATPPHTTTDDRQQIADARAHAHAHAQGWVPPLAWDDIDTDGQPVAGVSALGTAEVEHTAADRAEVDEIAIDRAVNGTGMPYEQLTDAELGEVLRRLTARGLSLREIAQQLHTTARTISRWREGEHASSAA